MKRLAYIEFARGYAILSIVCFHVLQRVGLPPLLQQAIIFGGTGVHLFFLLSGFGLCLGKPVPAAVFFKKRFTKVWLPYVLVLTISLVFAVFFGTFPDRWPAWLAGVGLYQMFFNDFIESFGGHFWFISAIFQFYLAFPALLFLKKKLGDWPFFALCLAISVGWWLAVFFLQKGGIRVWNSFFLQFLWEFALGMVLAAEFGRQNPASETRPETLSTAPASHLPASVFLEKKTRFSPSVHAAFQLPGIAFLPLGLVFSAIMVLMILKMGAVGRIFNDIPALIGYAGLSIFLFKFSKKWLPPVERFFRWVGGFSYTLYLTHILVLELFLMFLEKTGQPLGPFWPVVFLMMALLVGWLFEPVSQAWVGVFDRKKNDLTY